MNPDVAETNAEHLEKSQEGHGIQGMIFNVHAINLEPFHAIPFFFDVIGSIGCFKWSSFLVLPTA